ncbi:hypothetical protein GCM10009080_20580 [Cupriavidus pauculus]
MPVTRVDLDLKRGSLRTNPLVQTCLYLGRFHKRPAAHIHMQDGMDGQGRQRITNAINQPSQEPITYGSVPLMFDEYVPGIERLARDLQPACTDIGAGLRCAWSGAQFYVSVEHGLYVVLLILSRKTPTMPEHDQRLPCKRVPFLLEAVTDMIDRHDFTASRVRYPLRYAEQEHPSKKRK